MHFNPSAPRRIQNHKPLFLSCQPFVTPAKCNPTTFVQWYVFVSDFVWSNLKAVSEPASMPASTLTGRQAEQAEPIKQSKESQDGGMHEVCMGVTPGNTMFTMCPMLQPRFYMYVHIITTVVNWQPTQQIKNHNNHYSSQSGQTALRVENDTIPPPPCPEGCMLTVNPSHVIALQSTAEPQPSGVFFATLATGLTSVRS